MTLSLVLSLAITGMNSNPSAPRCELPPFMPIVGTEPLRKLPLFMPVVERKVDEDFYRNHLAHCRSRIAVFEECILLYEKWLAENGPFRYTDEGAKQLQAMIDEGREFVEKLKQEEKQFLAWEEERKQNPNRENLSDALDKVASLYKELWLKLPAAPMPREVKP